MVFNMIKNNKNYKLLIGLLLGFIFSSGIVVYAWYNDYSSEVSYDNSSDWLVSTNVHDAVVELTRQKNCPVGFECYQKKSTLALGDYVSYTPVNCSYSIDLTKTGGTTAQSIIPCELDLWRVLSINGDGTVDIISEYVSSDKVLFDGVTGYKNFVGYLNVLASQYETSGVTVGSRHFGYNGQTEYITDDTYFSGSVPWLCDTGSSFSCDPYPDDYESSGGGDTLYLADLNLVDTVLGNHVANNAVTFANTIYWMASRYYSYSSDPLFCGRLATNVSDTVTSFFSLDGNSGLNDLYSSSAIRPIVTLSSTLTYSGVGNKDFPMEITN